MLENHGSGENKMVENGGSVKYKNGGKWLQWNKIVVFRGH